MAKPNATALAVVSQDVESYSAPVDYSREQIQLIKDTYAKGASDAELALFIEIAKRKGLDIFSKQICLIGRWDSKLGREVRDPQTTIDGYRLIAERTGRYVPGRDTVYQYSETGHILCATAYIKKLVAGEWHEIAATAFFEEYKQTKKDGTLNATWSKMPHVMIAKCAESLALRKAFPAELSGIYTQEEMGSEVIDVKPEPKRIESPRQTVESLSERITKVEGGYDCDDDGEIHAIRKDAEGIFCSCGSRGSEAQCIHRLALKLWTARQAAAAPTPEPEPEIEDVEGEIIDPQEPLPSQTKPALSKQQFIALCELTRELEAVGISEDDWRAKMERISGFRSRKTITEEHLARVIFAFNKDLEAASRKGRRK